MNGHDLASSADTPRQNEGRTDRRRKRRLVIAFLVAGISDALSIWLQILLPLQWGLDLLTAVLLFLLVGRKWVILPALIAEAIPGLGVFPFWVIVVGSIAAWGTIRAPGRSPVSSAVLQMHSSSHKTQETGQ